MAVFRVEKNKNYTTMANFHFRDTALSWKAKGILSTMLSLPDNWDYSLAGLVTLSTDGTSATRSAIKELEECGYLIRRPIRDNGKICDWEYLIFESPQMQNQDVDLPVVDFPQIENRTQLSTKEVSIKESSIKELNTKKSDTVLPNNTAKKKQPKSTIFEDYAKDNSKLLEALQNFEKDRKERKQPMTERAKQLFVNKLESLSSKPDEQVEIINQSIENGWKSIYPLKGQSQQNKPERNYNYSYGQEGVDYL